MTKSKDLTHNQRMAINWAKKFLIYVVLITLGLFFVFPLVWMILTSFKSPADLVNPHQFFPSEWRWQNYIRALTAIPFFKYLKNSVIITILCIIGSVGSSTLTGYAFAKLRFPGKNFLFIVCIALMMIPNQIIAIPMFTMYKDLGFLNTYIPLTVPCFFGFGCSMYIFLMRQFFSGIPKEISESGVVDGAGQFRIFWSLVLPLAKPGLITVTLFTFMFTWNDFFSPLIYLTDPDSLTLAIGLRAFQSQYTANYELMMAAAVVAMIPTVVLFFCAQKQFISGITFSGIKG